MMWDDWQVFWCFALYEEQDVECYWEDVWYCWVWDDMR